MGRWIRHISATFLFAVAIVSGLSPEVKGREEAEVANRAEEKKAQQGAEERDSHILAKARETAITLKASPVKVAIEPVVERKGVEPKGITECVKSLGDAGQLHLVLKGLRTEIPPGVLYELYLDLPSNPTAEQKRVHSVGVINFFSFVASETEDANNAKNRPVLSLNVTKIAKRLQTEGKLKDKPVLTIIPAGKPDDDAKPVIGEISLNAS